MRAARPYVDGLARSVTPTPAKLVRTSRIIVNRPAMPCIGGGRLGVNWGR